MTYLLLTTLSGRPHYWNTCGWTDQQNRGRRYDEYEARHTLSRMQADGVYGVLMVPYSAMRRPRR